MKEIVIQIEWEPRTSMIHYVLSLEWFSTILDSLSSLSGTSGRRPTALQEKDILVNNFNEGKHRAVINGSNLGRNGKRDGVIAIADELMAP